MQPCDALTITAVLSEARQLLMGKRVEKIQQPAKDEIIISWRDRSGTVNLLLSVRPFYARICLIESTEQKEKTKPSNFLLLMSKYLQGAHLVGIEQLPGERSVDFVFSSVNEVGEASLKVLTVELMGKHSNMILWDKNDKLILTASHMVTSQMSRFREVIPGIGFVRPPVQNKPNIFKVTLTDFYNYAKNCSESFTDIADTQKWLTNNFSGIGSELAFELIELSGISKRKGDFDKSVELLGQQIKMLQSISDYKPAICRDLTRYTLIAGDCVKHGWEHFDSVNEMICQYYTQLEKRDYFAQLQNTLLNQLKTEETKLKTKLDKAMTGVQKARHNIEYQKYADLILAHITEIQVGQKELICEDLYSSDGGTITVPLDIDLTASQNAQSYYRQVNKAKVTISSAKALETEINTRLSVLNDFKNQVLNTQSLTQLEDIKQSFVKPKLKEAVQKETNKRKAKHKLLSVVSSDGWTIYLGKNRIENDQLISKMAQPHDIWMHVLGQGGAHVLIKVPSSKKEPPAKTLNEAAFLAAFLSKAKSSGKVRVVYTHCRYVHKIPKGGPGLVTYENEKTLEVDTTKSLPKALIGLFGKS